MTAPDPKTVRAISRTAVGYVIRDHLLQAAMAEHGISADDVYAWSEVYDAVLDTIAVGVQEPDEQMSADSASGEQQDGAGDDLLANAATCQSTAERVRQTHAFRARNGYQTRDYDDDDVLAVLDNREQWRNLAYSRSRDRDALAARVAELEAHPALLVRADREADEADVRAVAEACFDFGNDEGPRGIRQLYARFADRIAAQAGDETDGSGT